MAERLLPPRSTGVSDIMDVAKRVFRLSLAKSLPLALFAALFYGLSFMYLVARGKVPDMATYMRAGSDDPVFWWLTLAGFVGGQYFSAALLLRQRAMAMGTWTPAQGELLVALRRLPAIVLAMLLVELTSSLGLGAALSLATAGFAPVLLFLVVPAGYLSVCFLVIRPQVALTSMTPWRAWVHSVRLIQPLWVRAFAVLAIAWMILLVCLVAALALVSIATALLGKAGGAGSPVQNAIVAAVMLGLCAAGISYLNAVWLALHAAATAHTAASSSA
jgi:hypothetical protein